jgi:hypothetical protein
MFVDKCFAKIDTREILAAILKGIAMLRKHQFLVAAAVAGTALPTLAQAPASQSPPATQKPNVAEEVICKKEESTGSRIGAKRVCMTRTQWADRLLQDRQELERAQTQRGAVAPGE